MKKLDKKKQKNCENWICKGKHSGSEPGFATERVNEVLLHGDLLGKGAGKKYRAGGT